MKTVKYQYETSHNHKKYYGNRKCLQHGPSIINYKTKR